MKKAGPRSLGRLKLRKNSVSTTFPAAAIRHLSACFCLLTVTCCMGPRGYVSQHVRTLDAELPAGQKGGETVHTKTFFALHIRHARFLTFPSACTTSGASSMPNLQDVSGLLTGLLSIFKKKRKKRKLAFGVPQRLHALHTSHPSRPNYQTAHRQC